MKIEVTEHVASLVKRLQTDEGFNEQKAFLADAMSEATKQYAALECYDADSFLPLTALSMLSDLVNELAKSKIRRGLL